MDAELKSPIIRRQFQVRPSITMSQLRSLLRLMDDDSSNIRAKVAERLRLYGNGIWDEIRALGIELTEDQKYILNEILALNRDEVLKATWSGLQSLSNEYLYLENALLALSYWQSGPELTERGRKALDDLADDFLAIEPNPDSVALSHFLFEFRALRGAPTDDYYNPLHSDIAFTLENGNGLPIILACIFILVGHRTGLQIQGCNFPGHFLARDGRRKTIFDPYNGGKVLSTKEVAMLIKAAPTEMNSAASSREIVARVLRNLSVAYHQSGDVEKSGLFLSLLRSMDGD